MSDGFYAVIAKCMLTCTISTMSDSVNCYVIIQSPGQDDSDAAGMHHVTWMNLVLRRFELMLRLGYLSAATLEADFERLSNPILHKSEDVF